MQHYIRRESTNATVFLLIGSQEFLFKIESRWSEKNESNTFLLYFVAVNLYKKHFFRCGLILFKKYAVYISLYR